MVRSPGFGSTATNRRPIKTRFPFGSGGQPLNHAGNGNSPAHSSTGTRSGSKIALPLLVGTRIHVLFHSPPGVLFTFPSRYSFTIGHQAVLSLARWSSRIQPGLHVARLTRVDSKRHTTFDYRAITVYGQASQPVHLIVCFVTLCWLYRANRNLPRPHIRNAGRLGTYVV
jgi:hypothetical protein